MSAKIKKINCLYDIWWFGNSDSDIHGNSQMSSSHACLYKKTGYVILAWFVAPIKMERVLHILFYLGLLAYIPRCNQLEIHGIPISLILWVLTFWKSESFALLKNQVGWVLTNISSHHHFLKQNLYETSVKAMALF